MEPPRLAEGNPPSRRDRPRSLAAPWRHERFGPVNTPLRDLLRRLSLWTVDDLRVLVERELGPDWRAKADRPGPAGELVAWMLDGAAIDHALERARIRDEGLR